MLQAAHKYLARITSGPALSLRSINVRHQALYHHDRASSSAACLTRHYKYCCRAARVGARRPWLCGASRRERSSRWRLFVVVANPSNLKVKIRSNAPNATVFPIELPQNSAFTATNYPRIIRNEKFRKVLHELQIDDLPNSTPHKRPLTSLVINYLDVFAVNEADVGTTSLAFYEIDTADLHHFRQPIRRFPYGDIRGAIVFEIEKLTNAWIVRLSTSPWTSFEVMVHKNNNSWRMYVDYRRLKSVTKF